MTCEWCTLPIPSRRSDARHCSKRCRQTAWRFRQRALRLERIAQPMSLAYADPPYPGHAELYRYEATYAGEVDHRALIAQLRGFDGWALSTSEAALADVLALCPPGVRVMPWCKPFGVPATTFGAHCAWEPLIVSPARELRPGFANFLLAHPARGGGTLPGRKPLAFCAFLFRCLGARAGDTFADLYPGTGIVSSCARQLSLWGFR